MRNFIVIPTYNEKENISSLIEQIFSLIPDINILVVDDNSPDGTAEAVRELVPRYSNLALLERPKKEGLGAAYIGAFKKLLADSNVENIIMMDADFSHNPLYLKEIINQLKDYNLVMGSRYIDGGGITNWEVWRRILSWGGNLYARLILGWRVHDWTTGYNGINTALLRKINLDKIKFSGYAFIMGLKYFLIKADAKFKEIPIIFEERRKGKSKMSGNIIREGLIAPWKLLLKK